MHTHSKAAETLVHTIKQPYPLHILVKAKSIPCIYTKAPNTPCMSSLQQTISLALHLWRLTAWTVLLCCRHTSRFLLWWLTGFPFAAWSSYGWVTPFITALVSFLLLGTENIGIQIEEPFEVLPLDSICDVCAQSVEDLMEGHAGKPTARAWIDSFLDR